MTAAPVHMSSAVTRLTVWSATDMICSRGDRHDNLRRIAAACPAAPRCRGIEVICGSRLSRGSWLKIHAVATAKS
jgi:hypothetical protein